MRLINRHKSCIGITLWRWNRFQIELWYCPKEFRIEKHSHENVDIELTFITGNAIFSRQKHGKAEEFVTVKGWKTFGKTFSIPAGTLHWFNVSSKSLVFINREYWKIKPTSASIDFKKYAET